MASKVKDLRDVKDELNWAMWNRNGMPQKEAVEQRLRIK